MAGLFGALFLLACGGAHAYKGITESIDNQKSREAARQRGQKYYHALDGQRSVDTNHKVLNLPDGIKDMETGQWLYDKKKEDAKERKQLSELESIAKKEAIIKGKDVYTCKVHGSDPIRMNIKVYGSYNRLTSNDMPVKKVSRISIGIGKNEKYYTRATELSFDFFVPIKVDEETKEKAFSYCKDFNMKYILRSICEVYPINQVKAIYNYCVKYNIPIGTWDEIEAMMLEEHPLGWRKVPACENYKLEDFMKSYIL